MRTIIIIGLSYQNDLKTFERSKEFGRIICKSIILDFKTYFTSIHPKYLINNFILANLSIKGVQIVFSTHDFYFWRVLFIYCGENYFLLSSEDM